MRAGWEACLPLKREDFLFRLASHAPPPTSPPVNCPPATPLHPRPPASNKSPSHTGALTFHSPRGLDTLIRPSSIALPLPFPVPRRNSLERSLTDAQILRTMSPFLHWHHVRSCFIFLLPMVQNVEALSIQRQLGGHRGGGCDSAKPTSVVCGPKPPPSSPPHWISLDLIPLGRTEHQMFSPFIDPCRK